MRVKIFSPDEKHANLPHLIHIRTGQQIHSVLLFSSGQIAAGNNRYFRRQLHSVNSWCTASLEWFVPY